tara:strand:- start:2571 stop:2939 length:369 start_codon:yes stop_codon:yes gene_type:complete
MKIKIGKFEKDIEPEFELATCLEFTLIWADSIDDSANLIRINAAAIGIALDSYSILPQYKPEKDKILGYGRKILQRLLEKNVTPKDIYSSGTEILTSMSKQLPNQETIDEKKDFFHSPKQET